MVTVVTPLYRAAPYVEGLVETLSGQTFKDFEWICVDDASPDDSAERVQRAAGDRLDLRVLRMPMNVGPSGARNAGLHSARGTYVAFLDADDLWHPRKLELQVAFMRAKGHAFTFHDYRRMTFDGVPSEGTVRGPDVVDWKTLHGRRGIGCLAVMLERAVVPPDLFPSRETLPPGIIHEDFVAWSRLLANGLRAFRLPEDLALYRVAKDSRSASTLRGARSIWYIYRHVERIPVLPSSWYFMNYVLSAGLNRLRSRVS